MNFFEHQDRARKNTRWLVLLFLLAVLSLVAITNIFLLFFPWFLHLGGFSEYGDNELFVCLLTPGCQLGEHLQPQRMVWSSLIVVGVIGGVSLYKWISLQGGGKAVAEMMGGTMVNANTIDPAEKRLLNVVEEMALAAQVPVPAVYLLKEEQGINAFAAGFSTRDAVVAVTNGLLLALNRDQLQGVIAHEFSHILNGDMRLNMKLIAVLHGIMFITEAGFAFLRGLRHSRRERSGPTAMLGIGLVVIGALGTFFGNLIKAAVSRQREFLADASAVQFTRNPDGIAGALKVIGGSQFGSRISDSHGSEISHLFFGSAMSWAQSFFATHPPLSSRIRRIEPRWDGRYARPAVAQQVVSGGVGVAVEGLSGLVAAGSVVAPAAPAFTPAGEIHFPKRESLHEPLQAAAAIACLLLHLDQREHTRQLEEIRKEWPALCDAIVNSSWRHAQRDDFLPVAELAVSGLRLLSEAEYGRFKQLLLRLMKADGNLDIYEWSLYTLVKSSVDSHFGQKVLVRAKYRKPHELEAEISTIIAMLVHSSSAGDEEKLAAFRHACQICGLASASAKAVPLCRMGEFTVAVKKATAAYPLLKARMIKALVEAARHDGSLEIVEKNTIIAVAAVIDSPVVDISM
jgi:Zn-dependent protease with chaperone function